MLWVVIAILTASSPHAMTTELSLPPVLEALAECSQASEELKNLFDRVHAGQEHLQDYGGRNTLQVKDPATGSLVTVISSNVRSTVFHVIPDVINTLKKSKFVSEAAGADTSGDLPHKRRTGVLIDNLRDNCWMLVQLNYCDLFQTGEVTDHNQGSNFFKSTPLDIKGNFRVDRKLRGVGCGSLADAVHWDEADRASAQFLAAWSELSMKIMETHTMIVNELHLHAAADYFKRNAESDDASGRQRLDAPSTKSVAVIVEEVINTYRSEKGFKKLHNKDNALDVKRADHSALLADYAVKKMEAIFDSLMEKDAKSAIIGTPHRYNKHRDSVVQLSTNLSLSKAPGEPLKDIEAAWRQVASHELLSLHKHYQYNYPQEKGVYDMKGVAWSEATERRLYERFWPEGCNAAANTTMQAAIEREIVPQANRQIKLLDSSGSELRSPGDGQSLNTFEAACAFGELSNVQPFSNYRDSALCIVGFDAASSPKFSSYYGNPRSIQCVLPGRFVYAVQRGSFGDSHKKAGEATERPSLSMPFDDMKAFMINYTKIRKSKEENVLDKGRHGAFATYDDTPPDTQAYTNGAAAICQPQNSTPAATPEASPTLSPGSSE